jgi:hypothetical protein
MTLGKWISMRYFFQLMNLLSQGISSLSLSFKNVISLCMLESSNLQIQNKGKNGTALEQGMVCGFLLGAISTLPPLEERACLKHFCNSHCEIVLSLEMVVSVLLPSGR